MAFLDKLEKQLLQIKQAKEKNEQKLKETKDNVKAKQVKFVKDKKQERDVDEKTEKAAKRIKLLKEIAAAEKGNSEVLDELSKMEKLDDELDKNQQELNESIMAKREKLAVYRKELKDLVRITHS